jgi:hypothetical protein
MSFFARSSFLAALIAAGCSSTSEGTGPGDSVDSGRRALSTSVIADGSSTVVNATVVDSRGLPAPLHAKELFIARIEGDDYVLTLARDNNGAPAYRATLPLLLHSADVELRLVDGDHPDGQLVAFMRLTDPFNVETAPHELRVGDELRVELTSTSSSGSGALIRFEGACLPTMLPAPLQTYGETYGGRSEARFDTTNLRVTGGGCDVTTTIMFVDEYDVYGYPFDSAHSPKTQAIQQRAFVMQLAN